MMLKGATKMLSSGKVKWLNLEVRKNPKVEGWPTAKQIYDFLDVAIAENITTVWKDFESEITPLVKDLEIKK